MAINLSDITGNGNTLTNTGGVESSTTAFGESTVAVDLEASESDYLSAADSASLSIGGSLTIEGWRKFESLPSAGNVMWIAGKWKDDTDVRSYVIDLFNDTGTYKLRCGISTDGTFQAGNFNSLTWTPSTGVYYHLGFIYDSTGPTFKVVVDGVQLSVDFSATGGTPFNGTQSYSIGAGNVNSTPDRFFDGLTDDDRVWNVARTVTQVNDNKSLRLTGSESGLVAYWPYELLFSPRVIMY